MGHWITDEDGQHLYISDRGEVLATHAAISKASGGTERGKALAARSKAAILKKKAGGAAKPKPAGSGSIADRMAASADAAKARAEAAKASGNRPAELQAHEHRALILAKQNNISGVHKSGQGQVAPGTEKTAAAGLVAKTRGGGTATPKTGTATPAKASPQPPARTAKPAEPATIGHKPGESFSLIQRPATRSGPSAVNTGKGTTKFMFDMNKRDKPGQTSMFDKPESKSAPAAKAEPSYGGQTLAQVKAAAYPARSTPTADTSHIARHEAAAAAIKSPRGMYEAEFLKAMTAHDTRQDMARGNAVKIISSVGGVGRQQAENIADQIESTRAGSAHFSATGRTGYEKPTAGITRGVKFLPTHEVYRAAHKAAGGYDAAKRTVKGGLF